MDEQLIPRRRFIVGAVGAVAALGLGARGVISPASKAGKDYGTSKTVVVPDATLCIGCLTCEVACTLAHQELALSPVTRINVLTNPTGTANAEVLKVFPGSGTYQQFGCKQCPNPECVPVCPTGAMSVDGNGVRYVDQEKCIGCGKCVDACPYSFEGAVPDEENTTIKQKRVILDAALNKSVKCDMCRQRAGGPACVEQCPVNMAIKDKKLKSDHLCLELKPCTEDLWKTLP